MMYYSASMNTLDESLMNAVKEGKLLSLPGPISAFCWMEPNPP